MPVLARQTGEFLESGAYIPPGDPATMMQAVIDSVDLADAPKRLVLGNDAYSAIHEALTKRLSALEAQKQIVFPRTRMRDTGRNPSDFGMLQEEPPDPQRSCPEETPLQIS